MGKIVVKDGVRYRAKDADRKDIVPVKRNEPVADTGQWAEAEAEKARAALQAELDETRRKHETELEQARADFEKEIAARLEDAGIKAEKSDEKSDDVVTKVEEPETTKVREPETVKRGRGRQASDSK